MEKTLDRRSLSLLFFHSDFQFGQSGCLYHFQFARFHSGCFYRRFYRFHSGCFYCFHSGHCNPREIICVTVLYD